MIRYTTQVLPSRSNNLGIITLNHPKALHALTLDMIYCIQDVVRVWCYQNVMIGTDTSNSTSTSVASSDDDNNSNNTKESKMKAILFKSIPYDTTQQKARSFCAGGNVKDVYLSGITMKQNQQEEKHDQNAVEGQHGYGKVGLLTADFFRQEYIMNYMLSQLNGSTVISTSSGTSDTTNSSTSDTSSKDDTKQQEQKSSSSMLPIQISIWDGIVMGGGIGISIYGKYRIASENTIFSMPETNIGLFPDVGSMYILPRIIQQYLYNTNNNCNTTTDKSKSNPIRQQLHSMSNSSNIPNHSIITYLLLTGIRLRAYDVYHIGFATHYIPSSKLIDFEKALVDATTTESNNDNDTDTDSEIVTDVIGPVLDEYHVEPIETETSILLPNLIDIINVFTIDSTTTIESIVMKLQQLSETSSSSSSKFASETLEILNKMSPTSLKLTLHGLQRNIIYNDNHISFYKELQIEYRIAQHCMNQTKNPDFYEGIRATLIDKDYQPKWIPSSMSNVTNTMIDSYINDPIPYEWELPKEYNLKLLLQQSDDILLSQHDSKL